MSNILDLNGADISDQKLSFPYQAIQSLINATWNLGTTKADALSSKLTTADAGFLDLGNTPTVTGGSVAVPSVTAPGVVIPESADISAVMSSFDSKYTELVQILSDKAASLIYTYFPNEANTYSAAENWLRDALADPTFGLPAAVREQLIENDRSIAMAEATQAGDSILATFAARRYPLPPGAAASAVMKAQQKAQAAMAESSRKLTALTVDNMRFAVEKALGLRQEVMSASVEYVKALASGPDIASRVISTGYDAQSKLISAAADFYRADAGAKEMVSKVAQYNESLQFDSATKNQTARLDMLGNKVKALLAECQALATQTASLFNNIHVSAETTGRVSDNLNSSLDLTP